MSLLAENAALVTLLRTGRRPWSVYAEQVEEEGSASAVLERERGGQQDLLAGDQLDAAARAIAGWEAQGIRLITVLDPDYPDNLRAVHDRPPVIFVTGELRPEDSRSVAVVGARRASRAGILLARRIAARLVGQGFTVFSGLAAGIDTAAHAAALETGGRTIAVIGTGLNRTYPPQNAALQRRLAAECAVVSQFWPDAPPSRRSFPMRNAVMSGITLGTVVVEASETSGARTQARLALAQGRPVFLPTSLMDQDWARSYASRPGAHVFEQPEEITVVLERLTASDALTG